MKLFYIFTTATALTVLVACAKDIGLNPDLVAKKAANTCDTVTYTRNIKPIIDNKCVSCHYAGGTGNGDYSTSPYAGLKQKVDNGSLKNRAIVLHDMPQGGPPLSQAEMDLITCWLDAGAPNN